MAAPVHVIDSPDVPGAGVSTQPDEDAGFWTPTVAVRPPADLEALANLTQVGSLRRSCIAAVVHNTVGLGLTVEADPEAEEQPSEEDLKAVKAELDELARRDTRLHSPNFSELLAAVKWDEQEVGNGYIEVSRNRLTGEIDGLFHVVGKRVRRLRDRSGWIVGPRNPELAPEAERVRYYDFGQKVQYDDAGKPLAKLQSSGKRWDTNELIPFQLYTSESRDYGLPPDASLAVDYLGDKLAGSANVGYFDNAGVPPSLLFLQGEPKEDGNEIRYEVTPETTRAIGRTLRADGDKRHRVGLITIPPNTNVQKEDLAVLSERDIGFVAYRSDNRRRFLGAWRISPVFVADIDDAGKYTAETERAITKEQVFDPEQERWEGRLATTLLAELLPGARINFNELAIEGGEVERGSANEAADRGAITWGEFREAHNLPPLPEAKPGAMPDLVKGEMPAGWANTLMPAQQAAPPQLPAGDPVLKAAEDELEAEIRGEFERNVRAAVGTMSNGGGEHLDGIVVEKVEDGTVRLRPLARS